MSDLLEKVLAEYCAAKIQSIHLMNYNGANLAYNHAADVANKLGLQPEQKLGITPYPSNTNINIAGESAEQKRKPLSPWVVAGLSALGGGGLAGGALGLAMLLGGEDAPPPQEPPAAVSEHSPGSVGLEVEGWQR